MGIVVVCFHRHDGEIRTNRIAKHIVGKRKKMVTNAAVAEDISAEVVETCTESPHGIVSVRFHVF